MIPLLPHRVGFALLPAWAAATVRMHAMASSVVSAERDRPVEAAMACPPPMRSSVTTRPARRSVAHSWRFILPLLACGALLRACLWRERTAARTFRPLPLPGAVMPHLVRGVSTLPSIIPSSMLSFVTRPRDRRRASRSGSPDGVMPHACGRRGTAPAPQEAARPWKTRSAPGATHRTARPSGRSRQTRAGHSRC